MIRRLTIVLLFYLLSIVGCDDNDEKDVVCNLVLSITKITPAKDCYSANGSFSVLTKNASTSLQIKVNGVETKANIVSGLLADFYLVSAEDEHGCEAFELVEIKTAEVSGVSWSQTVRPILIVNCYLPTCHDGKTGRGDFSSYPSVKEYANRIVLRTKAASMPPWGSLDSEHIQNIACWVADGTPEN
jgi:hypothetical protein